MPPRKTKAQAERLAKSLGKLTAIEKEIKEKKEEIGKKVEKVMG